jgi:GR25 family glycosyltransferase involved in LPS biosynthesis
MKVFYINLDRSQLRRERIEACLNRFEVPHARIEAVDARNLLESDLEICADTDSNRYGYFAKLNKAEVACFMSHKKALRQFLDTSSDQWMVLLEDDVEFLSDPAPVFQAVENKLNPLNIPILIKLYSRRENAAEHLMELIPEIALAIPQVCPLSGSAQIFNRIAAERFLTHTEKIVLPVDVMHQFVAEMGILTLQLKPSLTKIISEEVGGSTISVKSRALSWSKLKREFQRILFRRRVKKWSELHARSSVAEIRAAIQR